MRPAFALSSCSNCLTKARFALFMVFSENNWKVLEIVPSATLSARWAQYFLTSSPIAFQITVHVSARTKGENLFDRNTSQAALANLAYLPGNHVQNLVSVDFFTVPTIRFQVLYVFLVLAHERRRVAHFNVTAHPTVAPERLVSALRTINEASS
jgi:hypothetical protein